MRPLNKFTWLCFTFFFRFIEVLSLSSEAHTLLNYIIWYHKIINRQHIYTCTPNSRLSCHSAFNSLFPTILYFFSSPAIYRAKKHRDSLPLSINTAIAKICLTKKKSFKIIGLRLAHTYTHTNNTQENRKVGVRFLLSVYSYCGFSSFWCVMCEWGFGGVSMSGINDKATDI